MNIPSSLRGRVETPVDSRYRGGDMQLGREYAAGRTFVAASIYDDSRNNGTRLQTNSTTLYDLSAGTELNLASGKLALHAFGGDETYHQSFSSIAADRNA